MPHFFIQLFELVSITLSLVIIGAALFVPIGSFLSERGGSLDLNGIEQLLVSIGLSALFWSALYTLLIAFGIDSSIRSSLIRGTLVLSLAVFLHRKRPLRLTPSDLLVVASATVFAICTLSYLAYPFGDWRTISQNSSRELVGLAADHLIPFNFARYLTEGIPLSAVEIVQHWDATDRGPLAGILTATLWDLLGIHETTRWGESSAPIFFVYQVFLTFLNLFALLAVWSIGKRTVGAHAALLALAVLMGNYFVFINIGYAWPKFFMSYFALTSISLWTFHKKPILAGIFAALALLSHDSAIFILVPFGLWLILSERKNLRAASYFLISAFALYLPWLLTKIHFATAPRLLALHLFCVEADDPAAASLRRACEKYLHEHSFAGILLARIENLLFPIDFRMLLSGYYSYWKDPLVHLARSHYDSSFRLVGALGLPIAILSLCGGIGILRVERKSRGERLNFRLRPLVAFSFAALITGVVTFGCAPATSNHVWAYPAILVSALLAGSYLSKSGTCAHLIFGIALGANISQTILFLFVQNPLRPFIHGSFGYFSGVALCFFMSYLLIVLAMTRSEELEQKA